jgi:hypothetical protein
MEEQDHLAQVEADFAELEKALDGLSIALTDGDKTIVRKAASKLAVRAFYRGLEASS